MVKLTHDDITYKGSVSVNEDFYDKAVCIEAELVTADNLIDLLSEQLKALMDADEYEGFVRQLQMINLPVFRVFYDPDKKVIHVVAAYSYETSEIVYDYTELILDEEEQEIAISELEKFVILRECRSIDDFIWEFRNKKPYCMRDEK